jgi:predicted Zn finger-like uncharacterized protein
VYTQCPDCATVFRVTADVLRTAQGNVRCGVCSTSFDALEYLSEEAFRATTQGAGTPSLQDTITVEETPGTEDIELSTATEADSASESATATESTDANPASEQSFEFDGDIEDLEQLFVEMPATELQHMAAAARAGDQPPSKAIDPRRIAASLTIGREDLEPTDEHPILVLDESGEAYEAPEPAPRPQPDPRELQTNPFAKPRILIPDELRKGLAAEAAADSVSARELFEERGPATAPRRWPWTLGSLFLTLVLAAQVVHAKRNELIRKPAIGPLLVQTYSFLGLPSNVPADLAAYELRQWGAASDATQPGRLLLRASIVNRASYAQPYPLLRLALQDRFGTTVGVRDIEPADYLPGTGAGNLLERGQRADAEIRIVDPGKDAVGFEMDVCLPMSGAVHCANEVRSAAP